MKNRIKTTIKPSKDTENPPTISHQLTIRFRWERWQEFERLARNLGLTHDQLASAIIESNMEGDEGSPFYEVGCSIMQAVTDIYPEHERYLGPLRNAFQNTFQSTEALYAARKKVGAL